MPSATQLPAGKSMEDKADVPVSAHRPVATPMPTSLLNFIRDTSALYNATTRRTPDTRLFVPGPKPYSTGNSGAKLVDAVFKFGFPEARAEAEHCQYLGSVAPRIYGVWGDGYCMEKLVPAPWTTDLLYCVSSLLENQVWQRPPRQVSNWAPELSERLGIKIPEWAFPDHYCMCHGDPAVGNVLLRGEQLVIADPCAPRSYLPECAEIDQGKLLQSALGWEAVAYGLEMPVWELPIFSIRAAFWCLISVMRVQRRERERGRSHIQNWCTNVITGLRDELGV